MTTNLPKFGPLDLVPLDVEPFDVATFDCNAFGWFEPFDSAALVPLDGVDAITVILGAVNLFVAPLDIFPVDAVDRVSGVGPLDLAPIDSFELPELRDVLREDSSSSLIVSMVTWAAEFRRLLYLTLIYVSKNFWRHLVAVSNSKLLSCSLYTCSASLSVLETSRRMPLSVFVGNFSFCLSSSENNVVADIFSLADWNNRIKTERCREVNSSAIVPVDKFHRLWIWSSTFSSDLYIPFQFCCVQWCWLRPVKCSIVIQNEVHCKLAAD